jgi:DNA helicase-2/ATP-dependent DNA helicase PcrA
MDYDTIYDVDDRSIAFEKHTNGMLVSIAGPGTGKTLSLLRRSAALASSGEAPDTVCYLTFIREISNAFISDYIETFGQEAYEANKPRVSTLHSFACRLLRNWGHRIGYDGPLYFSSITAQDDDAAACLIEDLLPFVSNDNCKTASQLRGHFENIKGAWRDGSDPGELPRPVPAILDAALPLFRALRFFDWDQTVAVAHGLLSDTDTPPEWIDRIAHYFIDEYQDFNPAEQAFVELLAARAESVVIVGDDEQSIYNGRGGSPEGIRSLCADPSNDSVSLMKCYRCRHVIVEAANKFQITMGGAPRAMIPHKSGGEIQCLRFKSSKAEGHYLMQYLNDRIAELPEDPAPKDGIVCLFATRKALDTYFARLSPHVSCIRRSTSIPDDRLWLQRVLQLVATPNQRFVERLLLQSHIDNIKPRHRRLIVGRILAEDMAPSAACESLIEDGRLPGVAQTAGRSFCDLCRAASCCDYARIASAVAEKIHVDEELIIEHTRRMVAALEKAEQEDMIARVCDALLPQTANPTADPRSVLFITMHGAKGLTKKSVVMPGLEQAWMPGTAAGENLAEKQRLFYVALTRATDRVLITFPYSRAKGDPLNYPAPGRGDASSFIQDAGLICTYDA